MDHSKKNPKGTEKEKISIQEFFSIEGNEIPAMLMKEWVPLSLKSIEVVRKILELYAYMQR